MTTPLSRRRFATTLAACLLAPCTIVSACSSAPAALPACRNPEAAVLPHSAGSLTQTDTGAYCLAVGKSLDVFLTASRTARWSQIRIADTSVLGYGNDGVMTPPVGVTPGVVVAVGRGTSTITSTLPDGKTWTATVVVG